MVFGSKVGPFQKRLPGGAINHYHYFGMIKRAQPLPMQQSSAAVLTAGQAQQAQLQHSGQNASVNGNSVVNAAPQHVVRLVTPGNAPSNVVVPQGGNVVVRQQVVSMRTNNPPPPVATLQQESAGQAAVVVTAAAAPPGAAMTVPGSPAQPQQNGTGVAAPGRLAPGSPILKAQLSTPSRPSLAGNATTKQVKRLVFFLFPFTSNLINVHLVSHRIFL